MRVGVKWNSVKQELSETGEVNFGGQLRDTYPLYGHKTKRVMAEMNTLSLKLLWAKEKVDKTLTNN
jgi:hypothetical protein